MGEKTPIIKIKNKQTITNIDPEILQILLKRPLPKETTTLPIIILMPNNSLRWS